jgi:hypothetical protein
MTQEFGIPIESDGFGNPMQTNNLFEKQICYMHYIRGLYTSNKMGHFRITVNHHKNLIKYALGSRKA